MAMFRVRMDAADGDYLLLLIPLDDGQLDVSAPDPIGLFKGTWTNGTKEIYYGEVKVAGPGVVLEWRVNTQTARRLTSRDRMFT